MSSKRGPSSSTPLRNVAGSKFEVLLKTQVEVAGPEKKIEKPITSLEEVHLDPVVYENARKAGIRELTPVQEYTIPHLLKKKNLMCCSQTGSGKTAAFLLPIINNILLGEVTDRFKGGIPAFPQVLILGPTRELVVQICNEAKAYAEGTVLHKTVHSVYGGTNMRGERELLATNGCNIMVATVGRLVDIVGQNIVDLSQVKYFVLDEADEMMTRGFIMEIRDLIRLMPTDDVRTTAMFSATFPNAVLKASQTILGTSHIFIKVGVIGSASVDVIQKFQLVEKPEKMYNLLQLLATRAENEKIIIFCGTKMDAEGIKKVMEGRDYKCGIIHSELESQHEREEAIRRFGLGKVRILIATSVAARGLDIPKVSLVINFDLPENIQEYILRIGRTGRVGNAGESYSFFEPVGNAPLAAALLQTLTDSNQVRPEWLESIRCEEDATQAYDLEMYGWGANHQRQRNARGSSVRGVPLSCEDPDESWD